MVDFIVLQLRKKLIEVVKNRHVNQGVDRKYDLDRMI